MKILSVHNGYLHRGGEDVVAAAEAELLRKHGHEVIEYHRSNEEVATRSAAITAVDTLWSRRTVAEVGEFLRTERPQLIHVHNTFPLISPSLYWAAARVGVPVVQTLHNFRLVCPQAMLLREGRVCEACVGRTPFPGVVHGCYQGSSAKTALVASMLMLHRAMGTWRSKVSRYIALSQFSRERFVAGGLPSERISVKPNFVSNFHPAKVAKQGLLYVGRLSQEKGIAVMSQAASLLPAGSLRVAGAGPERALLESNPFVQVLGSLSADVVADEMSKAVALVFPSIWYETFGLVVIEAFAAGTAVIASRIGGVAELVEDGVTGLLFEAGNAHDLASKMQWALDHPEVMARMGQEARLRYERLYSAEVNYEQLMAIYSDALSAAPP